MQAPLMSDHVPSLLSEGPHHSSRSLIAFPAGTLQNWMLITAPDGAVRYGEFRASRDPSVVIARSVPLPARVLPRSSVYEMRCNSGYVQRLLRLAIILSCLPGVGHPLH